MPKYAERHTQGHVVSRIPASGVLMLYYILESTAERRARRNNDIKHLFQHLTIDEGMSFMEAYEAVGYVFYLSSEQIRQIIAGRC